MNDIEKQIKALKQTVKAGLLNLVFCTTVLGIIIGVCNNPAWMKGSASFLVAYIDFQVGLLIMRIDGIEED
jgi:hypothetical protein